MAKKAKKVEKETRRLMEGITDLVKKKGDRYKFKSKNKKIVKKVKKTCVHWIIRKGKEVPMVYNDPERPGYWKCPCGYSFPIKPATIDDYNAHVDQMLEDINQILFFAVKLGGDADDTKMFIRLKQDLPRFKKVAKQVHKGVNQRQQFEANKERSDVLSQFDAYAGFNYKA